MNGRVLAAVTMGALAALAAAARAEGASGEALFAETCAACHGAGGVGLDGFAPPLVDKELWTRLGDAAPRYVAGVMAGGLSGKITAGGIDFIGLVMPPMSATPTEDLVAISGYVLQTLNGLPTAPDAALIDEMKAKPLSHKDLRALRKGG